MSQILFGKNVAEKIYQEIEKDLRVLNFKKDKPILAIILIGNDPLCKKYINLKVNKAKKLDIKIQVFQFPLIISQETIIAKIFDLNKSYKAKGIIVQFPLPKHIDANKVVWSIAPEKDVDGFQMRYFRPPAPMAIIDLLLHYKISVLKKKIALIGYGALVGKPLATLLNKQGANIYVYDKKNPINSFKIKQADIVISAVGVPKIITEDIVSKEQIIIDAGTSSEDNAIIGDVDYKNVEPIVKAITPVPGGIGIITVAELFRNFVKAYKLQSEKEAESSEKQERSANLNIAPFVKRKR